MLDWVRRALGWACGKPPKPTTGERQDGFVLRCLGVSSHVALPRDSEGRIAMAFRKVEGKPKDQVTPRDGPQPLSE